MYVVVSAWLPPLYPETGSNIPGQIWTANRIRNTTLSMLAEKRTIIILYIVYRLLSSWHLTCAITQMTQLKNIIYHGIPSFPRQKVHNSTRVPTRS